VGDKRMPARFGDTIRRDGFGIFTVIPAVREEANPQ
jgi:hypothetical protein